MFYNKTDNLLSIPTNKYNKNKTQIIFRNQIKLCNQISSIDNHLKIIKEDDQLILIQDKIN